MDQGEFLAHVLGQGPGTLVLGEWSSGAIVPRRVSYPLPAGVVIQAPYFIPALEGAPINVIAADVDGADLTSLPATPSLIVSTSPHRYDTYWKLTDELTPDEALDYRQRIAPLSDVGEWFRVPGTINDKYPTNPNVEVVQAGLREYSASVFSRLPEPNGSTLRNLPRLDWTPTGMGPNEFVKNELPASYGNWRNPKTSFDDLVDVLVEAKNLTEEQAVYIAFNAAANPYKKLTYGADRETAKHFMRRKLIKPYSSTITLDISRVRKAKGGAAFERRHEVTKLAMAEFMNRGQLIRARDNGDPWYVERATGQPIMLTPHSERLRTFITMSLGVNPVDVEHRHIAYDIIARGLSLQPTVETTHLSWYHSERNVLSVFLGGPRVIDISPNGLSFSSNAEQGILFRVPPKFTVVPVDGIDLEAPKLDDWWEEFFPHFPNIVGADEEDVRSLLHVWLVFFLFRNAAEARPLLAMLGGWGCLSGETPIKVNRADHTRTYTLAELYRYQQGEKHYAKVWNLCDATRVLNLDGDLINFSEIEEVIYSGEKMTYTVTVEGHAPFRATYDHRFLTPNGYSRLSDLHPGDMVVCAVPTPHGKRVHKTRRTIAARFHPFARQKRVKWIANPEGKVYPSTLYCRVVLEANMNGLTVAEFLGIVNKNADKAATLTYLPQGVAIHHRDEDPENDSLSNLQVLTKEEHDALHHNQPGRLNGGRNPLVKDQTRIISIEPFGVEPTYDIAMKNQQSPNFVVNGVVVHNSGKSATGRLFYRLLYGPTIGLHEVTSREAYDTAMSNYPLLLFDNVDRQREWLTERLATSISRIEEARRKLYTDNDVYSITGDAMVGVTAHDPPFLAGDIIDRLLYVHFRKLADNELIPEALFRDRVNANRERFLSGLLRDAQKVLQTPQPPKTSSTVSWRIADFAHFGSRIAEALGIRQQFDSALRNLLARQVSLTLEDDQILIDALMSYDRDSKTKMVWKSASQLWKELLEGDYVTDEMTFQRKYKNAGGLGRRLFSTLPMIRKVIPGMEFETDDRTGWRTWRIVPGGSNGKGATK